MKLYKYLITLSAGLLFASVIAFAQEKVADMSLSFDTVDSVRTCKVTIKSEGAPVADVSVRVAVKRLYTYMPMGKDITTDENGEATIEFPYDLPGDDAGVLHVLAKVEDDENYGSFEAKADVNWGTPKAKISKAERSLAGSRGNAPVYFIVASVLIISGIWGTLVYVVLQVFKIRKISKHLHKN